MSFRYFLLIIAGFFISCHQSLAADPPQNDLQIFDKAPDIRLSYKCIDMVHAVNKLRSLGKENALFLLRKASQAPLLKYDRKLVLICRLLFVNPGGWSPPIIGRPRPDIDSSQIAEWPLFPLAVIDDVPFLLISGYAADGYSAPGLHSVNECGNLSMIDHDLPDHGFDEAANKLISEPKLGKLYLRASQLSIVTKDIFRQAMQPINSLTATTNPTTIP